MQALAIFDGQMQLIEDTPQPAAGEGEVVIRSRLAGICNTDLELVDGYYGYEGILGHEFVGEVIAGPAPWLGARVVGEINIACGRCDFCRAGVPSHCRHRAVLGIKAHHGVFAECFTLPVANLHRVPDSIPDIQAVFVEPLAAALQVLEMVHIRPSDRVIVLGAGKLGMLVAQVLRLSGTNLTVIIRHEKQSRLLAGWGIPTARFDESPPASADVVVDCTGRAEGLTDALHLLRAKGTLVLKSTFHGLPDVNLTPIATGEITVVGSRCGPFAPALRLLQAGLVDVETMIERRFPLRQGIAAFAAAREPGALKVVLSFED